MIRKLYMKIGKKENAFYAFLYDAAKWLRSGIRVPPFRIIYGPLSFCHYWGLLLLRTSKKILFDEPLFRYRCREVGKNLMIHFKVPLTSPNLHIYIGDDCSINGYTTFGSAVIKEKPTLVIGSRSVIGYEVVISAADRVELGEDCLVADRVFIADNNGHPTHPVLRREKRRVSDHEIRPVKICNNVWLGYQCVVLKGVTIGDNSIIGANSVVTCDVPANTIYAGNPARLVRSLPTAL